MGRQSRPDKKNLSSAGRRRCRHPSAVRSAGGRTDRLPGGLGAGCANQIRPWQLHPACSTGPDGRRHGSDNNTGRNHRRPHRRQTHSPPPQKNLRYHPSPHASDFKPHSTHEEKEPARQPVRRIAGGIRQPGRCTTSQSPPAKGGGHRAVSFHRLLRAGQGICRNILPRRHAHTHGSEGHREPHLRGDTRVHAGCRRDGTRRSACLHREHGGGRSRRKLFRRVNRQSGHLYRRHAEPPDKQPRARPGARRSHARLLSNRDRLRQLLFCRGNDYTYIMRPSCAAFAGCNRAGWPRAGDDSVRSWQGCPPPWRSKQMAWAPGSIAR